MAKFTYPELLPSKSGHSVEVIETKGSQNVKAKVFVRLEEDENLNELVMGVYENDLLSYKFVYRVGRIRKPGGLEFLLEDEDRVLAFNVECSENEHLVFGMAVKDEKFEVTVYDAKEETEKSLCSIDIGEGSKCI